MNTLTLTPSHVAISLLRRNLLRACHLLIAVGLGLTAWPRLLSSGADRPLMDGVVDAVLCALQLLAIVGVFAPVQMVVVLIFDALWKIIWVAVVALPLWLNDRVTPGVIETLFACSWAIPFLFIIPWRAILRLLVESPEPWTRRATDRRALAEAPQE